MSRNEFDQPLGVAVPDWSPPPRPTGQPLSGRLVTLECLASRHTVELSAAFVPPVVGDWTYLPYPPPASADDVVDLVDQHLARDWVTYAVRLHATGRVEGMLSLMRITPDAGTIEIGSVIFGPRLQRTPASTEAQRLLMGHAFDLGYRRLEWKCDALNAPSMRAAVRLGYIHEGTFRHALVYKGRNRDTAWWSITDAEWPSVRDRLDGWLSPDNFDVDGRQLSRLGAP